MNEYGKRLNAMAEWMGVEYQKHNRHPLSYTNEDLALIAPWFIHDDAEEYLKENFLIALKNGDLKNEPHPVATFMLLVHNLLAAKPKLPDPKCHARAHIHHIWFGVYDFATAVSMEKDSESGKWGRLVLAVSQDRRHTVQHGQDYGGESDSVVGCKRVAGGTGQGCGGGRLSRSIPGSAPRRVDVSGR